MLFINCPNCHKNTVRYMYHSTSIWYPDFIYVGKYECTSCGTKIDIRIPYKTIGEMNKTSIEEAHGQI